MDFLKLLWFLLGNTKVNQIDDQFQIDIRGLKLILDRAGNVSVHAQNSLRVNSAYVLIQCEDNFVPNQSTQAPPEFTPACCDHEHVSEPVLGVVERKLQHGIT
jgi:hypothetical protein